jgi:cell fate regulator YaaT (PSP1 superfamily)
MAKVIGVHLRNGGKIYYYDPGDNEVHLHDHVIVESNRGMEYGKVMTLPREMDDKYFKHPPRKILRMANEEDARIDEKNHEKEDEAYKICKQKIREHNLDMKLVEAEYTFDNNKLIFYFTADERVDFRDLVKDLAGIFRTRIELRQIGVRDETKLIGGIGICGRELCCRAYLEDFAPVSIKMAKEQNLSLNPTKISGVCGRLMCCLKNEEEAYEYLNKKLPRKGDEIKTQDGRVGEVQNVNILRQRVRVIFEVDDTREVEEFDAADLVYEPGVHKKAHHNKPQTKAPAKTGRNGKDSGDKKAQDGSDRKSQNRKNQGRKDRNGEDRKNQPRKDKAEDRKGNTAESSGEKNGDGERKRNRRSRRNRDRKNQNPNSNREGRPENSRTDGGNADKGSPAGNGNAGGHEAGSRADAGEKTGE